MEKAWIANYDYFVPETIRYPKLPLYDILELTCIKYEDNVACVFFEQEMTYGELRDNVHRLAAALINMGIEKGDRVAVMLPNCPQMVISYYAIMEAGGVVTNISPLHVEREIEYELNDSGSETIIYLDLFHSRVQAVKDITPLKRRIATSITDLMATPAPVAAEAEDGLYYFLDLLKGSEPQCPSIEFDPAEDLAAIQYTGGTTGVAKGVMLTHRNLFANTLQITAWGSEFIEKGKDVYLDVIPFFHSYGQSVGMNTAVFNAAKMILIPQFEINMMLQAIQKYQPNFFPGVPTIYVAVLNHPDALAYGVDRIKLCNSGSAPLPLEVHRKFREISGGLFCEGYGLSEASPVTHSNPLFGLKKIGSVGLPVSDTDCKIIDADGNEAGFNEPGELLIRGPQVMKGYWNHPEETAATLEDGWLHTGDVSTVDEDGYFYIVDRVKDMIIAGGFNIYPREIDEVLYEHPSVEEAVAVGIPDEYRGETVKAFIVLKAGETATEEEIIAFSRERLAAYKVPRTVEFRESLPKTLVGKVLRRALLEEELARREKDSLKE